MVGYWIPPATARKVGILLASHGLLERNPLDVITARRTGSARSRASAAHDTRRRRPGARGARHVPETGGPPGRRACRSAARDADADAYAEGFGARDRRASRGRTCRPARCRDQGW